MCCLLCLPHLATCHEAAYICPSGLQIVSLGKKQKQKTNKHESNYKASQSNNEANIKHSLDFKPVLFSAHTYHPHTHPTQRTNHSKFKVIFARDVLLIFSCL